MKKKYFYKWHGEDVKVKFGFCAPKENKENPLYWYNYEALSNDGNSLIPSVQVTTKDGQVFTIANHFGIGVYKLEQGGWPNCTHFSLDNDLFQHQWKFTIREFDSFGYAQYEKERREWQKEKYGDTKEWKKSEALLKYMTELRFNTIIEL